MAWRDSMKRPFFLLNGNVHRSEDFLSFFLLIFFFFWCGRLGMDQEGSLAGQDQDDQLAPIPSSAEIFGNPISPHISSFLPSFTEFLFCFVLFLVLRIDFEGFSCGRFRLASLLARYWRAKWARPGSEVSHWMTTAVGHWPSTTSIYWVSTSWRRLM